MAAQVDGPAAAARQAEPGAEAAEVVQEEAAGSKAPCSRHYVGATYELPLRCSTHHGLYTGYSLACGAHVGSTSLCTSIGALAKSRTFGAAVSKSLRPSPLAPVVSSRFGQIEIRPSSNSSKKLRARAALKHEPPV